MKYLTFIVTAFLLFSCSSAPPPRTFSVDLASPRYEAGEIEANLDRYLSIGSLRKSTVNVYYYPNEDAVCLQFRVQFVNCNQFWDKAGRDAFVSALKRYQEEYDRKTYRGWVERRLVALTAAIGNWTGIDLYYIIASVYRNGFFIKIDFIIKRGHGKGE